MSSRRGKDQPFGARPRGGGWFGGSRRGEGGGAGGAGGADEGGASVGDGRDGGVVARGVGEGLGRRVVGRGDSRAGGGVWSGVWGGVWGGAVGRVVGVGENPLGWSVPIGVVAGVPMRVHVVFPLWCVIEVVARVGTWPAGVEQALACVVAFTVVVLVREAGRVAWASLWGDVSDGSVVWPLGGLNAVSKPRGMGGVGWGLGRGLGRGRGGSGGGIGGGVGRAVVSQCGGVVVGVVLMPLLAAAVVGTGASWTVLVPREPLDPWGTAGGLATRWQVLAWWLYYANCVVLVMNVVVPAAVFDLGRGVGRVLEVALSRGRRLEAAALSLWVGMMASGVVALVALGAESSRLGVVAGIAALGSWLAFRSQVFVAGGLGREGGREVGREGGGEGGRAVWWPRVREAGAAEGRAEGEGGGVAAGMAVGEGAGRVRGEARGDVLPSRAPTAAEVDAILVKIAAGGMGSLSAREREFLARATARMREDG